MVNAGMQPREALREVEARLTAVDAELKSMGDRLDGLEAGQEALRRDVARIERKIDRQGNDIADTLKAGSPDGPAGDPGAAAIPLRQLAVPGF